MNHTKAKVKILCKKMWWKHNSECSKKKCRFGVKRTHKIWSDCVDWGDKKRYLWLFWFKSGVMFEGGLGGIMGSYVISPLWSLGGGIACDAQQGSTLSPTGASERSSSLGCSHSSGDKRTDGGDHILVCRRTNLSWRMHGLPPAQPPCRWTTPLSRSSPPRIMLSYTFLSCYHMSFTNIARYPDAMFRAKRKMIAPRRDNPRNLRRTFPFWSSLAISITFLFSYNLGP